jgi:hypothetical protein
VPAVSGFFLLGFVEGLFTGLFAGVPGALLLTTGLALLLLPGDPRVVAYMALGAVLGLLAVLPVMLAAGLGAGVGQALLSLASYVVAGRIGLLQHALPEGVPQPDTDLGMQA